MSEEPRYSVREIRHMRYLVEQLWSNDNDRRCYREEEKTAEIESILQTYMLNGSTIQDLDAEIKQIAAEETDDD